jgi:hypothetical protein
MNRLIRPKALPTDGLGAGETTHKRIRVLAHRWLPLLLRRVGVGARTYELLRERLLPDDELRARLDVVRGAALIAAAQAWSKQDRQGADLADAAAAIAGQLVLAIELDASDPELAARSLTRASEQLVGLLVVADESHAGMPVRRWWERLRARVF